MLETDFTWWIYLSWIVLGVFAIATMTFLSDKRIGAAVGVLILGALLTGFIRAIGSDDYFDIALLTEFEGGVAGELFRDEVGAVYTFADGSNVVLDRGEQDEGSFVINGSAQYAFVASVVFSNSSVVGNNAPQPEVLVVINPGETVFVPYRINYITKNYDDIPPKIDVSRNIGYEVHYWVGWADFEPALGPY